MNTMLLTAATAQPYSFGQALSLGISGISIVILALAFLAVLVVGLSKIVPSAKPVSAPAPAPQQAVTPAPVAAKAPKKPVASTNMVAIPENQSRGEINLYSVDDTTAAMIMAIISDTTKTPLNRLYFKSIREVK